MEYILLLVITVMIASLLTKQLVNRDPDSPGVLTSQWEKINQAIGADIIE